MDLLSFPDINVWACTGFAGMLKPHFREYRWWAARASPKQWADAWLLAFAKVAGGTLVTFDRALVSRGAYCLLD
jgi:hypothetical protein